MIKKLYIIAESSANLYTYAPLEKKRDDIQDQLVTGFITANVSFSEAVIGKGLNNIRVGGDRIIFYKDKSGLTIAAIVDVRDNVKLLEKVMNEILENFLVLFEKELALKNLDFSRTDKAKDFKYFIDDLCKKYISSRDHWKNFLSVFVGSIISFFLTFFILNPSLQMFKNMLAIIGTGTLLADIQAFGFLCFILQMMIFVSISPGILIGGLISGSKRNGRITAFIQYGILIIGETIFYITYPIYLFDISGIFFIICLLLIFIPATSFLLYFIGGLGGYITTRLKLYPLEELKMKTHINFKLKEDII
ncbi:MAG: hypothetical protein ACTSYZ_06740 [Candidatus Helarchaeota archaeon]